MYRIDGGEHVQQLAERPVGGGNGGHFIGPHRRLGDLPGLKYCKGNTR